MKPDYTKLTPELQEKIQGWQSNNPTNKQVQLLSDMADMMQELVGLADENKKASESAVQALGAVLTDAREQLVKLNAKEAPEAPDTSKPVVEAVKKLEGAIKDALSSQKAPVVNIPKADSPNVTVEAPIVSVDLSKIEKLIQNELPKAFNEAIQSIVIPEVEIPEAPDRWDEVIGWLQSIDTASRLKPEPGTMKVTNPDGSAIGSLSGSTEYEAHNDTTTDPNLVYLCKAVPGTAFSAASWQIKRYNKTTGAMTFADDVTTFTKVWDNRTSYTY